MADAVTSATWDQEVLKAPGLVLVDFWAVWCGPCRMVAPIVDEISKEYEGKLKVLKLNTDENPDVAGKYRIMGIPTLMFFKNGQTVDQVVGAVPKAQLKTKVDALARKIRTVALFAAAGSGLRPGGSSCCAARLRRAVCILLSVRSRGDRFNGEKISRRIYSDDGAPARLHRARDAQAGGCHGFGFYPAGPERERTSGSRTTRARWCCSNSGPPGVRRAAHRSRGSRRSTRPTRTRGWWSSPSRSTRAAGIR